MTKNKRQRTGEYHTNICRHVKNGLRYIDPYEYTFTTFSKGRWVGRSLVEVFQKEFIAHPKEYYEAAVTDGRITVNGKKVPVEYILDHNDEITHRTRCVENPVSGKPIEIVYETDEVVVVNKPSSIPVHACGGYRLNTLISILSEERENLARQALFPTHRIDRLTSGLVILGKNRTLTREISELLMAKESDNGVSKEYLALAKGKVEVPLAQEYIRITGYIGCTDHRIGKYILFNDEAPDSKWSETHVTPLRYFPDEDETLVVCKPITGRTHQIRLHLQFIGHPIVNDICYGGCWDETHPFAIPQIPSLQYDTKDKLHCGGIFLHAWRYKLPSLHLDLATPIPDWARGPLDSDN